MKYRKKFWDVKKNFYLGVEKNIGDPSWGRHIVRVEKFLEFVDMCEDKFREKCRTKSKGGEIIRRLVLDEKNHIEMLILFDVVFNDLGSIIGDRYIKYDEYSKMTRKQKRELNNDLRGFLGCEKKYNAGIEAIKAYNSHFSPEAIVDKNSRLAFPWFKPTHYFVGISEEGRFFLIYWILLGSLKSRSFRSSSTHGGILYGEVDKIVLYECFLEDFYRIISELLSNFIVDETIDENERIAMKNEKKLQTHEMGILEKAGRALILILEIEGVSKKREDKTNESGQVKTNIYYYFRWIESLHMEFYLSSCSLSPYDGVKFGNRGFLTTGSLESLFPIRVYSKSTNNVTKVNIETLKKLSSTPFWVEKEDIEACLLLKKNEINKMIEESDLKTKGVSQLFEKWWEVLEDKGISFLTNSAYNDIAEIKLIEKDRNKNIYNEANEDLILMLDSKEEKLMEDKINDLRSLLISKIIEISQNNDDKKIIFLSTKFQEKFIENTTADAIMSKINLQYLLTIIKKKSLTKFDRIIKKILQEKENEDLFEFLIKAYNIKKTVLVDLEKKYDVYGSDDLKKWKKNIQKVLSYIYQYNSLLIIKKIGKPYYLPHQIDFRGRMYTQSPLSIIPLKIIRGCINIGDSLEKKTKEEILKKMLRSNYYRKISSLIKSSNVVDYFKFLIESEIGKINTKKLTSVESPQVSILQIAEEGKAILKDDKAFEKLDINDRICCITLRREYKSLEKGVIPDYIHLNIDATASGQQMLAILTKNQNKNRINEILYRLNLDDSEFWYDTYLLAVQNYIKRLKKGELGSKEISNFLKHKVSLSDIKYLDDISDRLVTIQKYFIRSSVKKPIMTAFYNVTMYTSKKNFFDKINEIFENENLNLEDNKVLKSKIEIEYKSFYAFITDLNLKEQFNLNSLNDLVKPEELDADLEYYGHLKVEDRKHFYYCGRKFSFAVYKKIILDENEDAEAELKIDPKLAVDSNYRHSKSKRALAANLAHCYDARQLNYISLICKYPLGFIHDQITLNGIYKHIVLDASNEWFNNKLQGAIKDKINSIKTFL